jgi:NADH-quinone oxidoreductase subunit E
MNSEAHEEDPTPLIEEAIDGVARPHTVALLQAVQDRLGYLPMEALSIIAAKLDLPPATIYGVATFYNQFRFVPPGKRHVRVCMGTACHIKGGGAILNEWERKLGISDGDVTDDRSYSLEQVACVGCCALAPVSVVGDTVHGTMTPASVDDLLLRHQLEDDRERRASESEEPSQPVGDRRSVS